MQWSSIPSVKQLIAIGAGTGDVLSQCLTIPADSVTVFEADATLAQQLAKQFAGNKALNVKAHVVSDQAGTAVMSCFNLAQCNALAPATALLAELFPGLKALPEKEVQTLALANELNASKLYGQQNMLLLELPAQNLALLTHLAEADLLQHFSHLVVQHSEQPLYKSAAPLNQLTQYLADNGFELSETDNSDADFPLLRFYRDAQAQQLKQANQRIAELTTQLETEQQQRQQAKQQHDEALKAQSTTQAEITKQLDAAKQQLEAAKQQFANEQQQSEQAKAELVKQLEAAKQQAEQQKAELTKQLEAAKQQFAKEQQQSEQAKAELAKQLEAAKQQAEQQKAELAKQLDAAKQQFAQAQQQGEQAKAELAKQLEAAKLQAERHKVDFVKQLDATKVITSKLDELLNYETVHSKMLVNSDDFAQTISHKIDDMLSKYSNRLLLDISTKLDESFIDLTQEDMIKILPTFKEADSPALSKLKTPDYIDREKISILDRSLDVTNCQKQKFYFNTPMGEIRKIVSANCKDTLRTMVLRFFDSSIDFINVGEISDAENVLIKESNVNFKNNGDVKTILSEVVKFQFESFNYEFYDLTPIFNCPDIELISLGNVVVVLEKSSLLYDWRVFASVIEKINSEFSNFSCVFILNGLDESEISKLTRCL